MTIFLALIKMIKKINFFMGFFHICHSDNYES